jgi:hypothetical protein
LFDKVKGLQQIKYIYYDGNLWNEKILSNSTNISLNYIDMELDSKDNPHIIYVERDNVTYLGTLFYTSLHNDFWTHQYIDKNISSSGKGYTELCLDSNDNPHVVYMKRKHNKSENLQKDIYKYSYLIDKIWSSYDVDEFGLNRISMFLDNNNLPHFAYTCIHGEMHIYYSIYNGTNFEKYLIESGNYDSVFTSIIIDKNNYPHISYGKSYIKRTNDSSERYVSLDYVFYNNTNFVSENIEDIRRDNWLNDTLLLRLINISPSIYISNKENPYIFYNLNFHLRNIKPYTFLLDEDVFKCASRDYIHHSINFTPSTSYVGFKVNINGNLKKDVIGLSEKEIFFYYSINNGETWNEITKAITDSEGKYSVLWMPSATGNYLVKSVWEGNNTFPKSEVISSLSVIPHKDKYVFSVISNSTVSSLSFNSTNNILSFDVEGQNDTNGFVKITISKELINNVGNIKVLLDDTETSYDIISMENSWILNINYIHSIHRIHIFFPSKDGETNNLIKIPSFFIFIGIMAFILLFKEINKLDLFSKEYS